MLVWWINCHKIVRMSTSLLRQTKGRLDLGIFESEMGHFTFTNIRICHQHSAITLTAAKTSLNNNNAKY